MKSFRHPFLLAVAFLLLASLAAAREVQPLDDGWRFHLGDLPGAQAPSFDASGWTKVDLPHDWSIGLPIDRNSPARGGGGYFQNGIGWYRRTLRVPAAWRGQRVSIEFDGVYMNSEVWLNGVRLGFHPYGYTGFRYDLTPHLNFGGTNVIAVRVDNSEQPNSRWYSGSGIDRHVRLLVTAPVHVAPEGVFVRTTALSPSSATLELARRVRNDGDHARRIRVQTVIVDPLGFQVASTTADAECPAHGAVRLPVVALTIAHPSPWSPATPVRYHAATQVTVDGRPVDVVTTPFGIRTIRVSAAHGFELNGRTIKLNGADVHADNGPLGAAAFDRAEERRVRLLKAAGFNAIRTAHNPPSPAFIAACDRYGMLVMEESFDGWEKAKNPHDYSVVFKQWWRRDVDAMVRRDRNDPSVVLWSIGNEMYERGTKRGLQIARELTARIRELDPSRPITAAVNGPGKKQHWSKFDPLFATLDVAGYNYELARHAADHARVPSRVILVTESYQSDTFADWSVVHDTPYVIGDFVWSGMDYLGEAGIGRVFPPGQPIVKHWEGVMYPWHGAACGDLDLIGWRKPISHYRAIVWNTGEKLYAAVRVPSPNGQPWGLSPWAVPPELPSWTWPGRRGRALTVEVYSRYDHVKLYLNGRLLGEKPTGRAEAFKAEFAVPYEPGELRAVGVQDGRDAASYSLTTAGAPAAVRLVPDHHQLRADGQDLVFVQVTLTDAAGRLVPTDDTDVRFAVHGPATIAAIGNADLTSMQTYQANPHRTYQGRALVVLRATHRAGPVTLTASAPGLAAGRINVEAIAP